MFHIFIINFIFMTLFSLSAFSEQTQNPESLLHSPMKQLFSHKRHAQRFEQSGIHCTQCHQFSVYSNTKGPLAPPVDIPTLRPPKKICHECHLTRVSLPRPNQCLVCHSSTDAIKPKDHFLGWDFRHGKLSQMNLSSCTQCHSQQDCSDCHLRRDTTKPIVHPANFRLTHSIRARANPQSCVVCHQQSSFCLDCHTGARQ